MSDPRSKRLLFTAITAALSIGTVLAAPRSCSRLRSRSWRLHPIDPAQPVITSRIRISAGGTSRANTGFRASHRSAVRFA
jgi:hypothetical protein